MISILSLPSAQAQVMDRIEVSRMGKEAEITIHFSTRIQYLRHGPAKPGKLLRVFVRLVNSDIAETDLMQQTMSSPQSDIVPRFTITYPELSNGLVITFSQETSWDVRQGTDGRSVVIKVPALAGARDVLAEIRAIAHAELESAPEAQVGAPAVPAAAEPVPVIAVAPIRPAVAAPVPAEAEPAGNEARAAAGAAGRDAAGTRVNRAGT